MPLMTLSRVTVPALMALFRRTLSMALETMVGMRERMPANRMMEIPLPTPNSVTCSPIHITKEEPATKEMIMTRACQTVGSATLSRP